MEIPEWFLIITYEVLIHTLQAQALLSQNSQPPGQSSLQGQAL